MRNLREVREATIRMRDRIKHTAFVADGWREDIELLMNLADSFLAAEGEIPIEPLNPCIEGDKCPNDEPDSGKGCDACPTYQKYMRGYRTALDLCRPLIVKKDLRVKELSEALKQIAQDNGYGFAIHSGGDCMAIANSALKKEG